MAPGARGIERWLPALRVVRTYRRAWLAGDVVAGLVLTALLVPAGMGYAVAAGLPPITGLYATVVPLVVYAVLGPSRILVLGPDSSLAPVIAAAIVPLAAGDPRRAVELAGALSIIAGGMCVVAGLARFGFVTDVLARPVRYGYMNGIAVTVIVSQLPKLFGFSVDGARVLDITRAFVRGLRDGLTNGTALAIGLAGVAVILASKRWTRRVPGVLVCVVGATLVTWLADLDSARHVPVVGPVPRGFPGPSLPSISWSDARQLLAGAAGVAVVSFADTSVLSRSLAMRRGDDVDPDQEMVALGAANVAAGLFQGFPVSSSASRTPVAEQAGSHSQLTGLTGAAAILVIVLAAPGLVRLLPSTALAAVVITAALGLFELAGLRRLAQMRRSEFLLSMACFAAVLAFGVLLGIFVAVGLGLAHFIKRVWRPHAAVLGRVDGLKGYHDISRYPQARQVPGLLLFRWDAPLFFANADAFEQQVHQAISAAPTDVRRVVLTAEPMTDVDTSAAEVLERLHDDLTAAGIELAFAEMKDPVTDRLARYGLLERFDPARFQPTIGQAVRQYVTETGVDWVDWEDDPARRSTPPEGAASR